ncbi:MAG: ubiquinone/menaquinone biosynthesis methyltransferase [Thermoplasmataceae archaeon]
MTEEKEEKVREIFKPISNKYDLFDSLISFGMDQMWRKKLIHEMDLNSAHTVLDVGAGTGKISFTIERKYRNLKITAIDITREMFPLTKDSKVNFIEGSAMNLPFEEGSVDRVVSGFLTRNVSNLSTYINESYRVLNEDGLFCNIDIFDPTKHFIAPLFRYYFYHVVPPIYDRISRTNSYSYLAESVRNFVTPLKFLELMKTAGFRNIEIKYLGGGSVIIHKGIK